jgi:hypothetical protein
MEFWGFFFSSLFIFRERKRLYSLFLSFFENLWDRKNNFPTPWWHEQKLRMFVFYPLFIAFILTHLISWLMMTMTFCVHQYYIKINLFSWIRWKRNQYTTTICFALNQITLTNNTKFIPMEGLLKSSSDEDLFDVQSFRLIGILSTLLKIHSYYFSTETSFFFLVSTLPNHR